MDGNHTHDPYRGEKSLFIGYRKGGSWAGIAWQNPPNNWGDQEGGFDLTGATALEVWARGAYGGEKVSFGIGILEEDKAYPDSGIAKIDGITLTREWARYEVPLQRLDLSSIKTGFVVTMVGRRTPVTIHLDRIRFIQ